jgi:hypothetical protein
MTFDAFISFFLISGFFIAVFALLLSGVYSLFKNLK